MEKCTPTDAVRLVPSGGVPVRHADSGAQGSAIGEICDDLDTITKSAAAQERSGKTFGNRAPKGLSPSDQAGLDKVRRRRYALNDAVAELLPGHRAAKCLRRPFKHADGSYSTPSLKYSPSKQSAFYSGVFVCGNVWCCAVCAARKSELRRKELEHAVAYWLQDKSHAVYMFTFTFRHHSGQHLKHVLTQFKKALRMMFGERAYRVVKDVYGLQHSVRALEVTKSAYNGWHVHAHLLVFADKPTPEKMSRYRVKDMVLQDRQAAHVEKFRLELQQKVYAVWKHVASRYGLSMSDKAGVHVDITRGAIADYVAKFGREPQNKRPWGAVDELAKAHSKKAREGGLNPFELLELAVSGETEDCKEAALAFAEYASAFHGARQLYWSPGFRELVGLKQERKSADDPELDELDDSITLLTFDDVVWNFIVKRKLRAELLEVACSGDRQLVIEFLRSFRRSGAPPGGSG